MALLSSSAAAFERFDPTAAERWSYVQDGVMGGVSQGRAGLDAEGDVGFIRLTGDVSTRNNGGFIQVRARFSGGFPDGAEGLRLTVRGNGEPYYVFLRTPNQPRRWFSYRAAFPTTSEWAEVKLPFASFTASHDGMEQTFSPQDVISIGLVAYGRDHVADLSVAEISLY